MHAHIHGSTYLYMCGSTLVEICYSYIIMYFLKNYALHARINFCIVIVYACVMRYKVLPVRKMLSSEYIKAS